MANHFIDQSQSQSLDAPSKVVVTEKRVYPHQQAPEHRSQGLYS